LGLMDFADQIALAARLVQEQPVVGQTERGRFKVVLLDEYQDTSVAQALMLARLFSGPDAQSGLGHPVMAVGDPNQAIYGWRGASVSNILKFEETFPSQDGRSLRLPLTVNRRSDGRILDTANLLAEPLLAAYGDKVARLAAPEGAEPGHVDTVVFRTAADELGWLVDEVKATCPDGIGWSSIGVLSRDNAQAEEVYDALTSGGVPVEIVGLSGLLRLPRGRGDRRHLESDARRHRQRVAAHPAHGSTLGRSALATCACWRGGRWRSPERASGRRPTPSSASCCRSPTVSTPARCPHSAMRSSLRERLPTRPQHWNASTCWQQNYVACVPMSQTAARPGPAHHRHHRRRRRTRRRH
jgi:hypothetical protein